MTDKQPMQADGGGMLPETQPVPPNAEGESQGGAYPNPHKDREPGFKGGQTDLEYSGPDNPNATTKED